MGHMQVFSANMHLDRHIGESSYIVVSGKLIPKKLTNSSQGKKALSCPGFSDIVWLCIKIVCIQVGS